MIEEVERVQKIHCFSCDADAEIETEWEQEGTIHYCPFCGEDVDLGEREGDFKDEMLEQMEEFEDDVE